MSTATTNLPVLGHSLFAEVSKLIGSAFKAKAPASKPAAAVAAPTAAQAAAPASTGVNIWKLYRMSAGMDSVNPALFADRIVQD